MLIKSELLSKTKRILYLFDDLPSKQNPHAYINPLGEVITLSKECDTTIVSPVLLVISLRRYKENKEQAKKLPPYKYKIGSITCWRPRYIDFSFIPWKYRKHYFQIISITMSLIFLVVRRRILFDIIHANFIYRPGYVATLLGMVFKKPVIISAIGSDIHQNLYDENILFRRRTIFAMKQCTRIIAVSEFLKKKIADEGFGDKTAVNPRGFSEKEFYPMDKKECRDKLSLKMEKRMLLFVGNLVPIKGSDILIEAFKRLRADYTNMELILLGDGPEREVYEQQVRTGGLERCVFFLGRKEHKEIPTFINASDILVVPSRNEGLSLITIEALACGIPVVASRVGAIPEILSNDRLGVLVTKENPVALEDGIIKALTCSWDTKYLSDYATKKYSRDKVATRVLNIYDEVLN